MIFEFSTGENIPDDFIVSGLPAGYSPSSNTQKRLQETLFIVPNNDGEALRTLQILSVLKAPHVIASTQKWGATLGVEKISQELLSKVNRVLVFEMPDVKMEETLQNSGKEILIIDHHHYEDLDRSHPQSSLEQIAAFLEWPLTDQDLAIAVNDRSYIGGLKQELKLNNAQIENLRLFDLCAQGHKRSHMQAAIRSTRKILPEIPKMGEVFILKNLKIPHAIAKQELSIASHTGVVAILEIAKSKIGFSGPAKLVNKLMTIDIESLGYSQGTYKKYSGGDPRYSMYFNFKALQAPKNSQELLPSSVLGVFEEVLLSH